MINDALRLIRKFNDFTAKDLANELNISPSYLSEIENGKKTPSLDLINKYSKKFKIKPSTILFFSEELDDNNIKNKIKINSCKLLLIFMKALEKFGDMDD